MPTIPDEAIIGTAVVVLALQCDPEVVALKRESSDLEAKIALLPKTMLPCW